MKRLLCAMVLVLLLTGCGGQKEYTPLAATTLPVYQFTQILCEGTDLTVTRLVTEQVSCLHDYSLKVDQVRAAEAADYVVISGAGLEEFLEGVIDEKKVIDASAGIELLCGEGYDHKDDEHEESDHGHSHEHDPHIWLNPANARVMARNICKGLSERYPAYADVFEGNLLKLDAQLAQLESYGKEQLSKLSCRDMITFHDGFGYFAQGYDLEILEAVEEESGSEASARDLIYLIELTRQHDLPAIFTEISGSASAAGIIGAETGAKVYALDMAMAGDDYFTAVRHDIDTVKEALG